MNTCDHISWLHVCDRKDSFIYHDDRVTRVFQELSDVQTQHLIMICFLERKRKIAVMRELFSRNNFKRSHHSDFVNLRLDFATIKSNFSLLLLNSDSLSLTPQQMNLSLCHHEKILSTIWFTRWQHRSTNTIYDRLVFLFCDVICIFVENLEELGQVTQLLFVWFRVESASSLSERVRSRVVIIVESETNSMIHSFLNLEKLRFSLQQKNLIQRSEVFASITLMRLAKTQLSALARFRRLKKVILKKTNTTRAVRVEKRVLFSTKHIRRFLHHVIQHTAFFVIESFNFVAISRLSNEIRNDYETHLCVFLNLIMRYFLSVITLTNFLAFSILMNVYSSRMHDMYYIERSYLRSLTRCVVFDSRCVFRTLYRQHCFRVFEKAFEFVDHVEYRCSLLEERLTTQLSTIEMLSKSSALLRAEALKSKFKQWKLLRTHLTCLICVRRKLEHVLTCEHAVCDVCLQIFELSVKDQESCFRLIECIVCTQRVFIMKRIKSSTADARILSIDDEDIRDVVSLKFLRLLQNVLGSTLLLHDLFDQAFDISSDKKS